MPRSARLLCAFLVATLGGSLQGPLQSVAHAQFGGPGGGGMRPMGPGMGQPPPSAPKDEKEQAAEAAPEQPAGLEPALQPLPAWPGQKERALQFFQLSGYMRGRAYLFHAFDLGINPPIGTTLVAPFRAPFTESVPAGSGSTSSPAGCSARNGNNGCRSQDISGADMRLRLEPTINVSDQVRVKAQIDVFDNLVLGSTADTFYLNGSSPSRDTGLTFFSRTQAPPTSGVNSLASSIVAKRAWAEVRTPIGELRFGRMASHWGTGMFVNSGDCLDCDYGTNVDRLMFSTKAFNHFLVLMLDWTATGPTTGLYNPNQLTGVQYSADPLVSVFQFGAAIGRQDRPDEVRERVEKGEVVANYGLYLTFRSQGWDLSCTGQNQGTCSNLNVNSSTNVVPATSAASGIDPSQLSALAVPRNAWALTPDLWFRLDYKKLQLEAEAVLVGGQINNLNPVTQSDLARNVANAYSQSKALNIVQYGFVAKGSYRLVHDTLHLGLEIGFASGDGSEDPGGNINVRTARKVYGRFNTTGTLSNFTFDPDYHVDLIFWRRLVGAVTNAAYYKASVRYDILDNLYGRADVIYSMANNKVGWPGNDNNLGLELDGTIWYHNDEEGFSAGIAYGVFFPFAGLNFPAAIYGTSTDLNAQAAQTVQGRVAVKF